MSNGINGRSNHSFFPSVSQSVSQPENESSVASLLGLPTCELLDSKVSVSVVVAFVPSRLFLYRVFSL